MSKHMEFYIQDDAASIQIGKNVYRRVSIPIVNHVMGEITKRDVEQVSERLRALGWEEVVRCRDCKEFSFRDDEYATADWCDYWGAEVESLEGFCAWGERRND